MELKIALQKQKAELFAMKEALDLTTKQRANAEKDLAAIRNQLAVQEEEIAELYDLQDRLEQKNTLERIRLSFMESPRALTLRQRRLPLKFQRRWWSLWALRISKSLIRSTTWGTRL